MTSLEALLGVFAVICLFAIVFIKIGDNIGKNEPSNKNTKR